MRIEYQRHKGEGVDVLTARELYLKTVAAGPDAVMRAQRRVHSQPTRVKSLTVT